MLGNWLVELAKPVKVREMLIGIGGAIAGDIVEEYCSWYWTGVFTEQSEQLQIVKGKHQLVFEQGEHIDKSR